MKKTKRVGIEREWATGPIIIKKSPGKGRGVFADHKYEKGDWIMDCPALYLDPSDTDLVSMTVLANYVFAADYLNEDDKGCVIALGPASMLNHNQPANAMYTVFKDTVRIEAIKTIKPGEEIFIDYGWEPSEND